MNALKVLLAMELRDERLFNSMATRSVISLKKATDMQIDGEIFRNQREIRLRIGPAIQFIKTA